MPQMHRIQILPDDRILFAQDGTTLYAVLRDALRLPDAICGGNGTCGKCAVERIENGVPVRVLACQTVVDRDWIVRLPGAGETRVLLAGTPLDRAAAAAPGHGLAAAFDVGTTSIVCYLLDRAAGGVIASAGALNPQAAFGADVITRAKAALETGAEPLRQAVLGGMNQLLSDCCGAAGIAPDRIERCCIVGNSCMQHLLLGYPVRSLVTAPHVPFSADAVETSAASLGLALRPDASVGVLPLIGGFVGADTTGCLLATEFDRLPGNTLLLDIGTNGELVLGTPSRRIACSAAAGPAFEGGGISCGMRGASGAIDHVWFANDTLSLSVIGGGSPAGLCGSGLIDLIACLLDAGALEESGRFASRGPLAARICQADGMRAFRIAGAEGTLSGRALLLTQKDVRQVQLAKAAIFAAITLLAEEAGIAISDIDRVLLAGAFGSHLDAKSACAIGLIPAVLRDRIRPVGNAAGSGASLAACSDAAFAYAGALARGTECIEPAARACFQQRFLDALAFPAPPVLRSQSKIRKDEV